REPWTSHQQSRRIADVVPDLLQPRPSPGGRRVLGDERDAPEVAMRRGPGLVVAEAFCLPFLAFLLEMKCEFLAKLGFLAPSFDEPPQLAQDVSHHRSCSAGFNTRPIARANVSHLVRSADSCLRPALVSR